MKLTITLPGERPTSWNKFYSGSHWTKRKAAKDMTRLAVRQALPPQVINGEGWPAPGPVRITVTAYMAGRLYDVDNVCTKLYVDALKGWVINDDSPAHVTAVTPVVRRVDKGGPRVELVIDDDAAATD
jgi:hypothetical protein